MRAENLCLLTYGCQLLLGEGLVIKYRGGGGSSIFKLTKRGGSPKYWSCLYRGWAKLKLSILLKLHYSKRLKGKIYRESEILDPLWYCLFRASRDFAPGPTGASPHPQTPAELSNRYLTQMRIEGQRTAFEIHHCTKMQGFIVVTCSFWGEFELNLNIICLRFITNIINYVTGLAETKKCPPDLTFTKNPPNFLMLQKSGGKKMGEFSQEASI